MENTNPFKLKKIQVISKNEIPAIYEIFIEDRKYDLGTHQDLRRNQTLADFIPEQGRLSLSWTLLKASKTLEKHQHSNKSMVLIIKGSGSLIGDLNKRITEGDTVIIPENCIHGFSANLDEDLHALSIQFDEGLYEHIAKPNVIFLNKNESGLERILSTNQRRSREHLKTSFFNLLTDGTLKNQESRKYFYCLLHFWSQCFQKILHLRQGTVCNPMFASVYLQHFKEEFGHDEILKNEKNIYYESVSVDIEAYTSWFLMKALTGSELEKIVMIHLVLETSAHSFHTIAAKTLNDGQQEETYFDIHQQVDEEHSMVGRCFLENLSSENYIELEKFLNKCWDMLEAMLAKMNILIRN